MLTNTFKRILALALAGLMTVTALACGKSGDDTPDATTTASTTATTDATTASTETTVATTKYIDDLSEDLTYEGKKVSFLYREVSFLIIELL